MNLLDRCVLQKQDLRLKKPLECSLGVQGRCTAHAVLRGALSSLARAPELQATLLMAVAGSFDSWEFFRGSQQLLQLSRAQKIGGST